MSNVNNELIKTIVDNRPYVSLVDFYNRVHPNKQAMISLIKGGGFDQFSSRMEAMIQYIWITCDKKKRITLQNLPGLMRYDLIPYEEKFVMPKRVYEFNRYLKAECKDPYNVAKYKLDERAITFLVEIDCEDLLETDNLAWYIDIKAWDKIYQSYMDVFRNWISENKETILDNLNTTIFMEDWKSMLQGTYLLGKWNLYVLLSRP